MIVNDKALAKVLKRSGTAGFKLCVNGTTMRLVGWGWAARATLSDDPPKLVLSTLVEMLGYIPADGDCGHIYKVKDGWEWQDLTEAVFDAEYAGVSCRNGTSSSCVLLPIRYGGLPLIMTRSRAIYSVSGPGMLAVNGSSMMLREPSALCFGDRESEIYIECRRPEVPGRIWTQLEQIEWEACEDAETN